MTTNTKRIAINNDNLAALRDQLNLVQTGRAQNDIYARDVVGLIEELDTRLGGMGLTPGKRKGATYWYSKFGGASSKSYRYGIPTTEVKIERGGRHWYLVAVDRVMKWPGNAATRHLTLTDEQSAFVYGRAEAKARAQVSQKLAA